MTPWSVLGALAAEVPVEPDAGTAREWVLQELSKPEYQQDPSLLERFMDWLSDLFSNTGGVGDPITAALVVICAVVVAAIAYYIAGPVRLSRRAPRSVVVFTDDTRSAHAMRTAADAAAARGDWGTAVVERFRAVIRGLEERAILEPRPGRTAWEASETAGARLPALAGDLARGAHLFDDVCYGKAEVGSDADALLRALDDTAREARRSETAQVSESAPALPGTGRDA